VDSESFDTVILTLLRNSTSIKAKCRMKRGLEQAFPGKKIVILEEGDELSFR
jgi:hypothetical protein